MGGLSERVREFFEEYEKANAEFDVEKIGALYGDVFLFAGPNGAQAVKKEDFLRVLPKRKEFFKAAGLAWSRVERVDVTALDVAYAMAKVSWKMRFEKEGGARESVNYATYILSKKGEAFQIVFQLDHQDLAKRAQGQE